MANIDRWGDHQLSRVHGQPIVDRLSNDIRKAMNEPPMVEWLASLATSTSNITPDEFKARMQREVANYQQLIDKAGIKFE